VEDIVQTSKNIQFVLILELLLISAGTALAQGDSGQATKTLVVNGKNLGAQVKVIDGHSYLDVESLAEVTNASVSIEAHRVVVTIPASNSTSSANNAAPPQDAPGLSRDFASASVAAIAEMREWRGAIGAMITYGLVVSDSWSQQYHDTVDASLNQASLAATTDSDKNALPLLRNEFDKLTAWSDQVRAARQSLNGAKTVDPNSLQNDPQLATIKDCSRFLNTMIVSGTFTDNAACH
jgi:hypothetical protein